MDNSSVTKRSNIDSDPARALRESGQYYRVEANIDELTKIDSTAATLEEIRDRVFGTFEHVKNHDPKDLRTIEVQVGGDYFVEARLVQEHFATFCEFIDDLSSKVTELPSQEERNVAALRLSSLAYTFGIELHPYPDGNGQTMRLLALKLLHQHGGEVYKDQFLKFKRESDGAIIPATFYLNPRPYSSDFQSYVDLLRVTTEDRPPNFGKTGFDKFIEDLKANPEYKSQVGKYELWREKLIATANAQITTPEAKVRTADEALIILEGKRARLARNIADEFDNYDPDGYTGAEQFVLDKLREEQLRFVTEEVLTNEYRRENLEKYVLGQLANSNLQTDDYPDLSDEDLESFTFLDTTDKSLIQVIATVEEEILRNLEDRESHRNSYHDGNLYTQANWG